MPRLIMSFRYDEIKMECVSELVSALLDGTAEDATWMRFCELLDGRLEGDPEHLKDIFSLLWATVIGDDTSPIKPSDGGTSVRLFLVPISGNKPILIFRTAYAD